MSFDLRFKVAYFGACEKIYTKDQHPEISKLPNDWRRYMGNQQLSPIVGPFGLVYRDAEHFMIASRYMYASERPHYATLFRIEYEDLERSHAYRKWGSSNGISTLLAAPNDRRWILMRDRCMFEAIFQRLCRDEKYRKIVEGILLEGYTPVYHVRAATADTYWGASINPKAGFNTLADRDPNETEEEAMSRIEAIENEPLLIGKNRLGEIIVEAYKAVQSYFFGGMGYNENILKACPGFWPVPLPSTPYHVLNEIPKKPSRKRKATPAPAQSETAPLPPPDPSEVSSCVEPDPEAASFDEWIQLEFSSF